MNGSGDFSNEEKEIAKRIDGWIRKLNFSEYESGKLINTLREIRANHREYRKLDAIVANKIYVVKLTDGRIIHN
jgi:hypothetical protein